MKGSAGLYHVLESIQYGLLYLVVAFMAGVGLDFAFPVYNKKKTSNEVFKEVMFQCLALVVAVILVRYCVRSVPILFPIHGSGYKPYHTPEFNGEMMMSFVFIASQLNLINKVNLLASRLYTVFFKDERRIVEDEENLVQDLKSELLGKRR
jgi:hypothetical protein